MLQIFKKIVTLHLLWTSQTIVVWLYNPSRRKPWSVPASNWTGRQGSNAARNTGEVQNGSHSERRRSKSWAPRRRGESCRGLWSQFSAAAQAGIAGYHLEQGRH